VTNLAVDPACRRNKVAKRLLDHILDLARSHDCIKAVLEVRPSNDVALAFYRKAGFVEICRLRRYYTNPTEDATVMTRKL